MAICIGSLLEFCGIQYTKMHEIIRIERCLITKIQVFREMKKSLPWALY
jgi:hypothetical protein